jgi:Protein of unknown function (DUF2971)
LDDPQQEVQTPPNPDEDGFLYHYTSLRAFLGIIGRKTLRATDIKSMNDTMEHKLATGLVIDEIFKRIAEQNPPEGQSFAELTWPMSFFSQPLYVVCFSEDKGDRLSQWRAYGQDSGVCLAFRKEELQKWCETQSAGLLRKVRYIPEKGDEALRAEIFRLLERSKEERTPDLAIESHTTAAFHKHEAFEEEKEWRIVSAQQGKTLQFRERGSLLIPFIEHNFGPELKCLLAFVKIGPTTHKWETKTAMEQLLVTNQLTNDVRCSETPYRGF